MANQNGQGKITSKWWFWVSIVAWVFVVGGIYNATKEPEEVATEEATESMEEDRTSKETTTQDTQTHTQSAEDDDDYQFGYYLGMEFRKEGFKISITSIERNYQARYATPKSGKEFVKVNISMENIVKIDRSYNIFDWKIEDSNGDINDYTEAMMAQADDGMNSGELAPGGTKSCSIVFSVPAGDQNLRLYYNPDIFSSDRGTLIYLEELNLS